uniref:Retrotransposon protein n=1 Tax=Mesocestoides corti TaxID=53468 RepID=A0A5K3FZF8_MESCO
MLTRLQLDEYALNQWDDALPACLLAYRSAVHSSTGLTSAIMTFGHELWLLADVVVPPPREPDYVGPFAYVAEVRGQLRLSFDSARSQLALAHKRQKDYYDKRAHGTPVEEGDQVWMATTKAASEARKLQNTWEGRRGVGSDILYYCSGVTDSSHIDVNSLVEGEKHAMLATSCEFRPCGFTWALNDAPETASQSAHEFSVSIAAPQYGPTGEQDDEV